MSTSTPVTTSANLTYTNIEQYVAQVLLANQLGSQSGIPNALATSQLNTAILVDPQQIQAYRDTISDQMNAQTSGPRFEDLSDRIADITIGTTAQGASTLEVAIIDPTWALLRSGFVQTDELGYLWPPIEVKFPTDTSMTWRLCSLRWQLRPQQGGNLTFTFEDRIVSLLREMSPLDGIYQGLPNQTLGGFIQMLVDNTNQTLKSNIRLVQLIDPADPNYTLPVTSVPAGAENPLRKNPSKVQQGLTSAQQAVVDGVQSVVQSIFPPNLQSTSFSSAEQLTVGKLNELEALANERADTGGAGGAA